MKICGDGQEKSHQNIFKNQKFQSVWNLKLLSPPFFLILCSRSLCCSRTRNMIGSTSYILKRVAFLPSRLSTSTIDKEKELYIPQQLPHPPSFPFYSGQEKSRQTNLTVCCQVSPIFPTHQYPCNPLYTFCTDPCFSNCLRPAKERKALLHSTNRTLHLLFPLHSHIWLRDPLWLSPFK